MHVGVVGNPRYADLATVLARLAGASAACGVTLATEPRLAPFWDRELPPLDAAPLDALLTFGGDGTLLYGARLIAGEPTPILGVNLGRVGYLTTATIDDVERIPALLASGHYRIEPRLALHAAIEGPGGHAPLAITALNEVAVHKGGVARVVRLDVQIDGEGAGPYSADGLIVATPTGSTAYSLSAGGPILMPSVDAMVVTPICAHTLAVRPLVVPATSTVVISPLDEWPEDLFVSFDGQTGQILQEGARVVVSASPARVPLVRLGEPGFIRTLRGKLHWGDLAHRERGEG